MAMRSANADQRRPIRQLLGKLVKAPAALSVLWPVLLILGGYVGWHRWGSEHVVKELYRVDVAKIQITEPPSYVRANVVKTVYRDTAMEGLSLLDTQASAKIASAFSMHPWVRKVISVRKLPGGVVDIRLEYRQPVAMVLVETEDPTDQQNYVFPIDGDGVLLPPTEFARAETADFIHIEIPGVSSQDRFAGTPFGDPRVEAAASLAEVLLFYREQTQLASIGVHGDPRQNKVPQLELTKFDRTRLFWGSPPGQELPGEPTAEMKLRTLLGAQPSNSMDLRMADPSSSMNSKF